MDKWIIGTGDPILVETECSGGPTPCTVACPRTGSFPTTGFASELAPTTNNPASRYRRVQVDLVGAGSCARILGMPANRKSPDHRIRQRAGSYNQ